jgi:hypothetical protein
MRAWTLFPVSALLLAAGCAGPRAPAARAHAAPEAVLPAREADNPGLPDRIAIPAAYRLVLLEGHLALVRVADEQSLVPAPASLRVVTGEISRGELAYQPGLLPQELAAEVAANREAAARMDNALEEVMRRSRQLSDQALELKAESTRLAGLLQEAQARIAELEAAAGKPAPPKGAAP